MTEHRAGRGQEGVTIVGPSGRSVDVSWAGPVPVTGVSASVRYTVDGVPLGYQIGGPGYHRTASTVVAPAVVKARTVSGGREVVVSTSADGEVTMVTRRGPHHELMRLYLGPPPALRRTLDEFELFTIHDLPGGCWLKPRPGSLCQLVWEDVTVVVHGRGVVFVPDPRTAAAMVPHGAGTSTRHGEIWRRALGAHPDSSELRAYGYVVGGRRGAASVSIPDSVTTPDETLLRWLDSLEVSWR